MWGTMRTIIAGTRTITEFNETRKAIEECGWNPSVVLCGDASGPDSNGWLWADAVGIPVEHYPADWNTHDKAAGPIRNSEMVSKAEALILIWDGQSAGSRDVRNKAIKSGLRVYEHIVR